MKKKSPKKHDPDVEDPVLWMTLPDSVNSVYDFRIDPDDITMVLWMSAKMTKKLGLKGPKLIAARPAKMESLRHGMNVLYCENDVYNVDRVMRDDLTGLFVIAKGNYDFLFPPDAEVLGEPLGHCDVEQLDCNILKFRWIYPPGEGPK